MDKDKYDGRYNDRRHDTIEIGSTSGRSSEQNAREQAYQEYLKLRQNRSSRGNYVKEDTLYGEYIPKSSSGRTAAERSSNRERSRSIDDTPYGRSEKRRTDKSALREEEERRQYLEMREREQNRRSGRSKADKNGRQVRQQSVAVQGRKNRADVDKLTRAERKAAKHAAGNKGYGNRKKGRKNGRGLRVALLVTLILVIGIGGIIAAGLTVVKNTLDNVGRIELDPDMIGINPQVDSDLRNYRNIALLGIDSRDMSNDEGTRSDAMIVVSINKETNDIKMFSVYRDTLLDLGDDVGLDKITHAYYYGGPTKALYALNKNLDLNIKELVVVNWKAVADTVDALGGLDIEIQDSEIDEMNKYIHDTYVNIGGSSKEIESAGMQTLNGNQAVTYARIRKDAVTGDYRRNERMKIVVKAAFDKAKKMDVSTIKKISSDILPEIKTNMSSGDMMKLALKLNSYKLSSKNVGWPYETRGWTGNAWYGPPVTLYSNVSQLHEEFFGQKDYVPTQDVQSISESISAMTGYY